MKTIPIQVSIKSASSDWNPIFNSIQVGPNDLAAGSFLTISGENTQNKDSQISLIGKSGTNSLKLFVSIAKIGSGNNKYENNSLL